MTWQGLVNRLRGLVASAPAPGPGAVWDWIQIEVSSVCNASCGYCPVPGRLEPGGLMSMKTFERLVPSFVHAAQIHLQGWGEPLMNPRFLDMARLARGAGRKVSTTTNGVLMTELVAAGIVEAGLDLVAFSLAGAGPGNDRCRKGAELERVMEGVSRLHAAKLAAGSPTPDIHVAYMLLRSNAGELPRLPALLDGQGVSHIVVSTLDYLPSPELVGETLIPASFEEHSRLKAMLDSVAREAASRGMHLDYRLPRPAGQAAEASCCTENVLATMVVSWQGEVTPCVFTSPSARAEVGRVNPGLVMGNALDSSLEDIWDSNAYRAFRDELARGRTPRPCHGCLKLALPAPEPSRCADRLGLFQPR